LAVEREGPMKRGVKRGFDIFSIPTALRRTKKKYRSVSGRLTTAGFLRKKGLIPPTSAAALSNLASWERG